MEAAGGGGPAASVPGLGGAVPERVRAIPQV